MKCIVCGKESGIHKYCGDICRKSEVFLNKKLEQLLSKKKHKELRLFINALFYYNKQMFQYELKSSDGMVSSNYMEELIKEIIKN